MGASSSCTTVITIVLGSMGKLLAGFLTWVTPVKDAGIASTKPLTDPNSGEQTAQICALACSVSLMM